LLKKWNGKKTDERTPGWKREKKSAAEKKKRDHELFQHRRKGSKTMNSGEREEKRLGGGGDGTRGSETSPQKGMKDLNQKELS